jgi:prevent-host-death family protein
MDEPISAADANRNFSQLLRSVREDQATYVVTSHGKPVAKIVPFESDDHVAAQARAALIERLRAEPVVDAGTWTREELYEKRR